MVGVPGKSRACATCRARHIRCDLSQPICTNCIRAGKTCVGYERFPTFINRTGAGIQQRRHLEEVKVTPAFSDTHLITATDTHKTVYDQRALISNWQGSHTTDFLHWFHGSLITAPNNLKAINFMGPIMRLPSHGRMLHNALLAISTTRFGKEANKYDLVRYGQQLHVHSLGMLIKALENVNASRSDDTLACAVVLALYELLNVEDMVVQPKWNAHLEGISQLLIYRGPGSCKGPVARAILEHCREIIMTQSLLQGKYSVLGETVWMLEPWDKQEKPLWQMMCDFGLRLTNGTYDYNALQTRPENLHYDLHIINHHIERLCQDMRELNLGQLLHSDPAQRAFVHGVQLAGSRLLAIVRSDLAFHGGGHQCCTNDDQSLIAYPPDQTICGLDWTNDNEHQIELIEAVIFDSNACVGRVLNPGSVVRLKWALRKAQDHLESTSAISMRCNQLLRYFNNINLLPTTVKLR